MTRSEADEMIEMDVAGADALDVYAETVIRRK